ncbi:MAG: hypothetical protein K2X37_03345, partial [Chitinophagaceae bacterium]|nr:hypothetical protein [Chitinophagaceae bacterium]
IGTKGKEIFKFPEIKEPEFVSSSDAISDLPEKSIAEGAKYPIKAKSEFQAKIREGSKGLFNHHSRQLKDLPTYMHGLLLAKFYFPYIFLPFLGMASLLKLCY